MNPADAPLAALEALPHGVSVIDAARRLVFANAAFWRMAGGAGARLPPGTPVREVSRLLAYRGLMGPGDPEAQLATSVALDRDRPILRRLRSADGTMVHEVVSLPLPGGGYLTCAHDVTALVQAEAEAQGRLRLAETVLSHLSGGIVAYDGEDRIRLVNGAFELLTGLPLGTLRPGMTHRELLAAQVARGAFAGAASAAEQMERDRLRHAALLHERPSGEVLRFESRPLPDGGFVVEVDDITALKRAEDEATRRAALLDGVLDSVPYGVCIFGPDRRARRVNTAYARLFGEAAVRLGESVEELVARRLRDGEYDAPTAARLLDRSMRAPGEDEVIRRARPNGMVVESRTARLPDGGLIAVYTEITALHRAEEAARQRAALLDGVVSAMPHGVCVFGPDRRVTMFNAAYAEIMKGAPAAIGDHLDELTARRVAAGEYGGPYDSPAHRALRGGAAEEVVRRRPNGTVVSVRVAPLPDGGLVSVVTDVTALHRAEQAARERAAVLDSVLEALPDGVVVFGGDWRARMANAAYSRILGPAAARPGESLDELLRRRVAEGEMTAEEAAAVRQRRLAPDPAGAEPLTRRLADGRALTSRSARLPDGGHIAVISDVTALHQAEAELCRRASMQHAMLATMRHGLILYGPDRRVLACNAKASELTGMPAETLTPGRLIDDILDEQVGRGEMTPALAAELKTCDRSRQLHYGRVRPDGRVIDIVSEPTADGGFVITYSDVTEDRAIRAELERARAAAEAASQAKSRFLATMSHELRTPLAAVIGFSEAIAAEQDHTRIADYAAAVNEAGRHLLQLVDDILDVARSQTGALRTAREPFAPEAVLREAVRAAEATAAARGLTLSATIAEGLPALRGDPLRLRQIMDKLVSNALKFTPEGGTVAVSAEAGEEGLSIRVADTGIGIPPELREHVFEPFTQVDNALSRRFEGSGLGLHLARALTTALGGSLVLEDAVGPGTVALLRFPPTLLEPAPAMAGPLPA